MRAFTLIRIVFSITLVFIISWLNGQVYSKEKVKESFIQLLERPHVNFNPIIKYDTGKKYIIEKGFINSESTEKVPFLLYKPLTTYKDKLPIVICLHGTGGNKDQMKENLERFSSMGYMAIAIDARFHGERRENIIGKKQYTEAIAKAWQNSEQLNNKYPLYFDTVYDLWQLISYLKTRTDIDSTRIGMMGISMGGIETWLAASTNNSIKVTVPIIAVQSFKWSIENDNWQGRANTILEAHKYVAKALADTSLNKKNVQILWNKLIPGITEQFDCPSMLRLFAPRPLLILNTENDPNCPLQGAVIAIQSAKKEFELLHESEKFQFDIAPKLGHTFNEYQQELMYAFFKKWL